MWCSHCHRVFKETKSEKCPVCKIGKLNKEKQINCPECQTPMEVGYFSAPLKIVWRRNYVKGGKPDITLEAKPFQGGWIRLIAYHCKECNTFYITDIVEKPSEINEQKKVAIAPLCHQCGRDVIPGAKYCPYCGVKYLEEEHDKIMRIKMVNDQNDMY
ncbi:MAG: PF20097 family protein [Candidatus Odinarchaeia archaeon]